MPSPQAHGRVTVIALIRKPTFAPVRGDVLGIGVRPGPDVGALLREVEAWWIAEDFAPDRHALVKRLQQMAAQQQ